MSSFMPEDRYEGYSKGHAIILLNIISVLYGTVYGTP
jgi:hypothetical protein